MKNTKTLLDACKEVESEVNAEKTKYMFMFCHQNAGQNNSLMTSNKILKNVAVFKCFAIKVTNKHCIQIKFAKSFPAIILHKNSLIC
jgi:hypothetical protein